MNRFFTIILSVSLIILSACQRSDEVISIAGENFRLRTSKTGNLEVHMGPNLLWHISATSGWSLEHKPYNQVKINVANLGSFALRKLNGKWTVVPWEVYPDSKLEHAFRAELEGGRCVLDYGELDSSLSDLWIDQSIDLGKADEIHLEWVDPNHVSVFLKQGMITEIVSVSRDKNTNKWSIYEAKQQ